MNRFLLLALGVTKGQILATHYATPSGLMTICLENELYTRNHRSAVEDLTMRCWTMFPIKALLYLRSCYLFCLQRFQPVPRTSKDVVFLNHKVWS